MPRHSRWLRGFAVTLTAWSLMACASQAAEHSAGTAGAGNSPVLNLPQPTCAPTDQDAYVYRAVRLQVIQPCVRASGTLAAMSMEADGDYHISLRLDASDQGLLTPENQEPGIGGSLVVEPVCQFPPLQAEAIRVCAGDPDPYLEPLPPIGAHVWMEGRYVLDRQHHGWAELHPLYRWGQLNP